MKLNPRKRAVWIFIFALAAARLAAQNEPAWAGNGGSDPRFPAGAYLTAVGYGNSAQTAEMDAVAGIARNFAVKVEEYTRSLESYIEIVGGAFAFDFDLTDLRSEIDMRTKADNLVAVSIVDGWNDGGSEFRALAVMDKAKAIDIYEKRIGANRSAIRALTSGVGESGSFEDVARFRAAAVFADMNVLNGEMLAILGRASRDSFPRGEEFLRDAEKIRASIVIGINVRSGNDRGGYIRAGFARVFSQAGFATGETGPRYVLNVDFTNKLNNKTPFDAMRTELELSADLTDAFSGAILLPFKPDKFYGRYTFDLADAEDFTLRAAGEMILSEYSVQLSNYLSRLASKR